MLWEQKTEILFASIVSGMAAQTEVSDFIM